MGAPFDALVQPTDPYGDLPQSAQADRGLGGAVIPPGFNPSASPTLGSLLGGQDQTAAPPAPGTVGYKPPTASSPEPSRSSRSSGDPLQDVREKLARGEPVSPQDMMLVDAAQQRLNALSGGGGSSATSVTTGTSRQNVTPEMRALSAEGDQIVGRASANAEQLGAAREHGAFKESELLAQKAAMAQQEAAAMQKRQEEQTAHLERMQSDFDKASRDYVKQSQEIDPNRLLRGGKGVFAAIAMAFGASGAALARTPNFAQEIIDHKLTADLDAQKTALGAKRDSLTMAQQAFQHYRQIYQDDAAARAAVKATVYEGYAANIGSLAAKLQGVEGKQQALAQRDQLQLAANQQKQQAAALAAGTIQRSTTTQTSASGGASGTPVDAIKRFAEYANTAEALNKANASGGSGAPTEKDQSQYNEATKSAAPWLTVLRQADRLNTLAGKTNELERTTGFGEGGRAWDSAFKTFKGAYLQAITGAAFSPEQAADAKSLIEGHTYTSAQAQQKIKAAKDFILAQIQSHTGALHPQLQQQYRSRLRAGGVPDNLINEIGIGQTAPTGAEQGAALGLK